MKRDEIKVGIDICYNSFYIIIVVSLFQCGGICDDRELMSNSLLENKINKKEIIVIVRINVFFIKILSGAS